jgi:hypothetical protein
VLDFAHRSRYDSVCVIDGIRLKRIVSGGQTGSDRAGLDWARANRVEHGGWCPKGRKAEDGTIDHCYSLKETPSSDYPQRTEWNVRDSDATAVFTMTEHLGLGSRKTLSLAKKHNKPAVHVFATGNRFANAASFRLFITRFNVGTLNVAGSRGSNEPDISDFVRSLLNCALNDNPPLSSLKKQ